MVCRLSLWMGKVVSIGLLLEGIYATRSSAARLWAGSLLRVTVIGVELDPIVPIGQLQVIHTYSLETWR